MYVCMYTYVRIHPRLLCSLLKKKFLLANSEQSQMNDIPLSISIENRATRDSPIQIYFFERIKKNWKLFHLLLIQINKT